MAVLNNAQLAREVGYSAQLVGQYRRQGMTDNQIRAKAALKRQREGVVGPEVVGAFAPMKVGKIASTAPATSAATTGRKETIERGGTGLTESTYQAQNRKEIALANLKEIEVRRLQGELVSSESVALFIQDTIIRARDVLLRIGPELRDRLAQESDPNKVEDIINGEVYRALEYLSGLKGKKENVA